MFTVEPTADITSATVIKNAIKYRENTRQSLDKLEEYYLGVHEILHREKEDALKNNKVIVNHAKYITRINSSYLVGNPVEYKSDFDISTITNNYDSQTIKDIDLELAKSCSKFGIAYERVYLNEAKQPVSCEVLPRNIILIRDNTVAHKKLCAVIYDKVEGDKYYGVMVLTSTLQINYNQDLTISEFSVHGFDSVPIIQYINNSERAGDFKDVISLIDAYNLLQSDRINDKEQLVDAILVLYGISALPEQMSEIKKHRAFSAPSDARAEYLTKTLNETEVDVLRQRIEMDIHKISMTPNMNDEGFSGNSSGVALKFKLYPFELSIQEKESRFEKSLKERFTLYNHYYNQYGKPSMPLIDLTNVKIKFSRTLPQNDYETSQMITNLEGKVSDETLISQLSFVDNSSKELEKAVEESQNKINKEVPALNLNDATIQ